jgi:hypothetical protein
MQPPGSVCKWTRVDCLGASSPCECLIDIESIDVNSSHPIDLPEAMTRESWSPRTIHWRFPAGIQAETASVNCVSHMRTGIQNALSQGRAREALSRM